MDKMLADSSLCSFACWNSGFFEIRGISWNSVDRARGDWRGKKGVSLGCALGQYCIIFSIFNQNFH